jgi:hypothetical protein
MSLLWILLVVLVVAALVSFVGRGSWGRSGDGVAGPGPAFGGVNAIVGLIVVVVLVVLLISLLT